MRRKVTRQNAIDRLAANRLSDGRYIYCAEETGAHYVINESDLDYLAELMADDDAEIRRDAYSHWCAGTDSVEATSDQLDEIGADSGYRCECGEATGERCQWIGPRAETVLVEWMPEALRASHAAAGNIGTWPANGALRLRVHADCAELLTHEPTDNGEIGEPSPWARIVEGA